MRTATFAALLAVGLFAGLADATCYDWGLPGYTQNVADCHFADSLWSGYCTPPCGPPCGCDKPCCGGCGGGDAACGAAACGGGPNLWDRLKAKMAERQARQACSCCAPGGSWCDGCGGCGFGGGGGCGCGGGGCGFGRIGSGMPGWWHSFGASSGGGGWGGCGCGAACDSGCGGDASCGCGCGGGFSFLRGKVGHGICQRRYGPLSGFESLCERVRGYGSCRAWVGGGPLDNCGLASYQSYPNGIDYSYLNHVTAPAVYAAPSAAVGARERRDSVVKRALLCTTTTSRTSRVCRRIAIPSCCRWVTLETKLRGRPSGRPAVSTVERSGDQLVSTQLLPGSLRAAWDSRLLSRDRERSKIRHGGTEQVARSDLLK